MKHYDGLLNSIAEEYCIKQGANESEANFKSRIIYSVIARLSYASLWDKSDDDESIISIEHFKNRVYSLLSTYLELYSDVKISESLSEELYDLYLKTGYVYYRISASMPCMVEENKILFLRGITPDKKVYLSGAGFYLPHNEKIFATETDSKSLTEMFCLQDKTLIETWGDLISFINWHTENFQEGMEFLLISPSFQKGYWKNKFDTDGKISIARTILNTPRMYYFYKFDGTKLLFSQIPNWLTNDEFFTTGTEKRYGGAYRKISCACLASHETLPPFIYEIDGAIVNLKISYLPPPAELYLMCLYSWSQNLSNFSIFNRIFCRDVFFALKKCFENAGYHFIEGKVNYVI